MIGRLEIEVNMKSTVQIWDWTAPKGYSIGCRSSSDHCAHLIQEHIPDAGLKGRGHGYSL